MNISGLDRAAVLAALYNRARPQGMGFLQYDPKPMHTEEAQAILEKTQRFDYLRGRVMKINLGVEGDEIDVRRYDRDNGVGAADAAIASLRASGDMNSPEIQRGHGVGTLAAATETRRELEAPEPPPEPNTIHLRMPKIVGPTVDKIIRESN